jgi:hypothetical protein
LSFFDAPALQAIEIAEAPCIAEPLKPDRLSDSIEDLTSFCFGELNTAQVRAEMQ